MPTLGALLRRMLRPVPSLSELLNVGALLVTLLGGGTLFGMALGAGSGLALIFALLFVLAFWVAYQLQRELDRSTPRLSLGEPVVGPRQTINGRSGFVVRLPVLNEAGAADAQNVHASLRFTGEGDGDFNLTVPGRWRDAPGDQEITVVGNGRPHELDLFAHFPTDEAGQRSYVLSEESIETGIAQESLCVPGLFFRVEATVQGSHRKVVEKGAWRVLARESPVIIPGDELFPAEKAADEAMHQL